MYLCWNGWLVLCTCVAMVGLSHVLVLQWLACLMYLCCNGWLVLCTCVAMVGLSYVLVLQWLACLMYLCCNGWLVSCTCVAMVGLSHVLLLLWLLDLCSLLQVAALCGLSVGCHSDNVEVPVGHPLLTAMTSAIVSEYNICTSM